MAEVLSRPATTKLWTRLLVTYTGMMLRLTAMQTQVDLRTTPGFGIYEPGDVIIAQGERAQYVFHMTAGLADVLVDDTPVGIISPGEIFGAMAALTHAHRTATVRARSRCSVVKVPTSQFTDLIKSNPATIHALLTDMANSIVSLNEQLVRLRHPQPAEPGQLEKLEQSAAPGAEPAHRDDQQAAAGAATGATGNAAPGSEEQAP